MEVRLRPGRRGCPFFLRCVAIEMREVEGMCRLRCGLSRAHLCNHQLSTCDSDQINGKKGRDRAGILKLQRSNRARKSRDQRNHLPRPKTWPCCARCAARCLAIVLFESSRRVRRRPDVQRCVPHGRAEDVDCVERRDRFGEDRHFAALEMDVEMGLRNELCWR
jgi:hypothetical protein